jgi:Holliday junction resolvasome RuvABC endonuclease subunit
LLSKKEITDLLDSKGFTAENIAAYKNLDTLLKLKCNNGHCIEASIKTVRNPNFKCPFCEGKTSSGTAIHNVSIPPKTGHRVVAIDNASHNAGISVFDDGKLVFYHLYQFDGDTIKRLCDNRKLLNDEIAQKWKPDLVVLEDIQYQNNIQTFKTLAMLLGNSLVCMRDNNIRTETVLSKVWRAHFIINGKTRLQEKKQAIDKVKQMYNVDVNDDIAEAILLGKYAVDALRKVAVKKLF